MSLPLYDLRVRRIGVLNEVWIDCYDHNDCNYTITEYDTQLLTLYASMINQLGGYHLSQPFSVGIIRAHHEANTVGRFTISMDGSITFWMRLRDNNNEELYRNDDVLQTMLSILELASHERAHYEQPNSGHGDEFQRSYNTLMADAIVHVRDYENLAKHVVRDVNVHSQNDVAVVVIAIVVGILSIVLCVCFFKQSQMNESKRRNRYAPV